MLIKMYVVLDEVLTYKDLGVIVNGNLKVAEHCLQAYNKANKMLGLLKRTIKHRNGHDDTVVQKPCQTTSRILFACLESTLRQE